MEPMSAATATSNIPILTSLTDTPDAQLPTITEILGDAADEVIGTQSSGIVPTSERLIDWMIDGVVHAYELHKKTRFRSAGGRTDRLKKLVEQERTFFRAIPYVLEACYHLAFYGYVHGPYRDGSDAGLATNEEYQKKILHCLEQAERHVAPRDPLNDQIQTLKQLVAHPLDPLVQGDGWNLDPVSNLELLQRKLRVHLRLLNSPLMTRLLNEIEGNIGQPTPEVFDGLKQLKSQMQFIEKSVAEALAHRADREKMVAALKPMAFSLYQLPKTFHILLTFYQASLKQVATIASSEADWGYALTMTFRLVTCHFPIATKDCMGSTISMVIARDIESYSESEIEHLCQAMDVYADVMDLAYPGKQIEHWLEERFPISIRVVAQAISAQHRFVEKNRRKMHEAAQKWQSSVGGEQTYHAYHLRKEIYALAREIDYRAFGRYIEQGLGGASTIEEVVKDLVELNRGENEEAAAASRLLSFCLFTVRVATRPESVEKLMAQQQAIVEKSQQKKRKPRRKRRGNGATKRTIPDHRPLEPDTHHEAGPVTQSALEPEAVKEDVEVTAPAISTTREASLKLRALLADLPVESSASIDRALLLESDRKLVEKEQQLVAGRTDVSLLVGIADGSRRMVEASLRLLIRQLGLKRDGSPILDEMAPTHNLSIYLELIHGCYEGTDEDSSRGVIQPSTDLILELARANEIVHYGLKPHEDLRFASRFARRFRGTAERLKGEGADGVVKQEALEAFYKQYARRAWTLAIRVLELVRSSDDRSKVDLSTEFAWVDGELAKEQPTAVGKKTRQWLKELKRTPAEEHAKSMGLVDISVTTKVEAMRLTRLIGGASKTLQYRPLKGTELLKRRMEQRQQQLELIPQTTDRFLHQLNGLQAQDQWEVLHGVTYLVRHVLNAALWHRDLSFAGTHLLDFPSGRDSSIPLRYESDVTLLFGHLYHQLSREGTDLPDRDALSLDWLKNSHRWLNNPHIYSEAMKEDPFGQHVRRLHSLRQTKVELHLKGIEAGWSLVNHLGVSSSAAVIKQEKELNEVTKMYVYHALELVAKLLSLAF